MKHLVTISQVTAEEILSGKRSIYPIFGQKKVTPFGVVSAGDLVYVKVVKKAIVGQFRVQKVIFIDGLVKDDITQIRREYGDQIAERESYWLQTEGAKVVTLIFINEVNTFITAPIQPPKSNSKSWQVLN